MPWRAAVPLTVPLGGQFAGGPKGLAIRSIHWFNPVQRVLKEDGLKPWRGKMWCIPALDDVYNSRMTDILTAYERPYDAPFPVICLDEKNVS